MYNIHYYDGNSITVERRLTGKQNYCCIYLFFVIKN